MAVVLDVFVDFDVVDVVEDDVFVGLDDFVDIGEVRFDVFV